MTHEIPPELGAAFGVADAKRRGVPDARLRRRDLARPFRGARSVIGATLVPDAADNAKAAYPRSAEAQHVLERAAQYAPVLQSGAFFSGITAAVAWDAPLPHGLLAFGADGADGRLDPDILDVSVFWPARAPRRACVRGHAVRPGFAFVQVHPVFGFRLASPASTWAMLGATGMHPYDLVAVADSFVRVRRPPHSRPDEAVRAPLTTIASLAAALDAGRRTAIGDLRVALPRVRTGSASRTETWTRLTLVDAGLPEPVLDHDVFDSVGGFVARVDMAYPGVKTAVEYEGSHHNSDEHWESDIERYARLEAAGWRVIRVTKTMLFRDPDLLAARVRAALAACVR